METLLTELWDKRRTLSDCPSSILLELPFVGQYNKGAPSFFEHIQYMNDIGFVPFDICELHSAKNLLIQIDICFVRQDGDICKKAQTVIESLLTLILN